MNDIVSLDVTGGDGSPPTVRTRVAASMGAIVVSVLLLPLSDWVYRVSWKRSPAIADYVFFGLWAVSALLCAFGIFRREKVPLLAISAGLLLSPFLFMGIAG